MVMGNLSKLFQECPKTAMNDKMTETEEIYPFIFCIRGIIIRHHPLVMGVLEGMRPMGLKLGNYNVKSVEQDIKLRFKAT